VGAAYFPRRSLELLVKAVEQILGDAKGAELHAFLRDKYVDYKRADALTVLRALSPKQRGSDG
jgi:hypothetical protein